MKLKDYIQYVLESSPEGKIQFEVCVDSQVRVVSQSLNKLTFTVINKKKDK